MTTAQFYKERAEQAAREAAGSSLANVRDRNLRAEKVWLELADRHDKADATRAKLAGEKAAFAAAAAR